MTALAKGIRTNFVKMDLCKLAKRHHNLNWIYACKCFCDLYGIWLNV